MSISERVVEKCLSVAATKPCPDRFRISDGTADYYQVEIIVGQEEFLAFVDRVVDRQLPVLKLNGNQYEPHPDLAITSIRSRDIRVTHYYRNGSYTYPSAWCFLFGQVVRFSRIKHRFEIYQEERQQKLFNSQTLVVQERTEVLEECVRLYLEGRQNFMVTSLITHIVGSHRWLRHPQREELQARYRMILDSWAEEECFARDGALYRVLPKAFASLDNIQRDERRHFDMKRLNRFIVFLTGCLVLTGLLQAWATYVT